tara:strand:+ start:43 stop:858 length:816 start_codon:yes stop_codon:yes gene_type:complete
MSDKVTAYDNTVLGEGGYSDAGEIDLSKVLTGEDTSSTLIDAILPGLSVAGLLAKSRKGLQLIPKAQWDKIFGIGSKAVDKMPEGVKQLALAVKGKIKDGKMVADPGFKYGTIGKPKPKIVETITPKQVNEFIKNEATTNLPLYTKASAASKWNTIGAKKIKDASEKFSLTDPIVPSLLIPLLFSLRNLNENLDISGNISKLFRPDPDMGTKEQHDKDMDMIIKTMSPETKLKYLKQTGQGYPADEEMFLRAEPEDTNKILLELLRQQESQ